MAVARQRCWRRHWAIDLDIKGFFDNLDHGLLMKAICHHTSALLQVLVCLRDALSYWARRKYKRLRNRRTAATRCLGRVPERDPDLFID